MMIEEKQVSLWSLMIFVMEQQAQELAETFKTPRELEEKFPDTSDLERKVFTKIKAMQQDKRKERKPLRILWRTILVAAVLVSLLFATLMTNASVRSVVINTIIEWTGRDVGIRFEIEGEPLVTLPDGYGPHYIPEGFLLLEDASFKESNGSFSYAYQTEDGSRIMDIQAGIAENGSMYWMDNEHAEYEMITFQGTKAYLGHGESIAGQETYIMLWTKAGIEHFIYTTVSLSELFQIAENIY